MATVNIRRDVDDKFYRYKMPALLTKIEGRGNGIKTVIPNMDDVAKALSRPPEYPTKFFGCELGAQTTMANDRYIVNGQHTADRLRELLDTFIDKFVLCPSCKNPETVLIIDVKKEDIGRDCKACGAQTKVDMRHKLTTFILKNPPAGSVKGKKSKADKAAAKKDKYAEAEELREAQLAGTANIPLLPTSNGSGAGSGTASPKNKNGDAAAEEDEISKQFKSVPVPTSSSTGDDWAVDTSAEAVAARMKNLAVNVDGFAGGIGGEDDDDDVGGGTTKYTAFGDWLAENKATATDAEIVTKAKELEVWGKHKSCLEVGEKLWDAPATVVDDIKKRSKLLAVMTHAGGEKAQKSLLGGLERYLGISHPDMIPLVPKILMALYQEDVIEEEVVEYWGTHASKKYVDKEISKKVRKASEPFLKWLAEAESSEEDDDDEDDE